MEVFKLRKIIENQVIDVQLTLHKVEEAREELRKSLKRRRDIAIAENDTHYKEIVLEYSNGKCASERGGESEVLAFLSFSNN